MIRSARRRPAALAGPLGLLSCLVAGGPLLGAEPLPYALGVHVDYGEVRPAETVRERVDRDLVDAIQDEECFDSVVSLDRGATPEVDLILQVNLTNYREQTEYDISMNERNDPDNPPDVARMYTVEISVNIRADVLTAGDSRVVRSKAFRQVGSWRPQLDEDPRYEAVSLMIDNTVKTLRGFVCKGSPKKWAKELAKAREPGGAR